MVGTKGLKVMSKPVAALVCEADDEDTRADDGAGQIVPASPQLAGDGPVADDWSCHELRKHRDVERNFDWPPIDRKTVTIDVNDVGKAMEREEGYSKRQGTGHGSQLDLERGENPIEIFDHEFNVFENRQQQ